MKEYKIKRCTEIDYDENWSVPIISGAVSGLIIGLILVFTTTPSVIPEVEYRAFILCMSMPFGAVFAYYARLFKFSMSGKRLALKYTINFSLMFSPFVGVIVFMGSDITYALTYGTVSIVVSGVVYFLFLKIRSCYLG